jgi:hypothetical protein
MSADDKVGKQDSLPFPPTPSASIAGRTMQESVYKRRVEPRRLPADVPNILIVLIDDARSGLALHPGRRSAHEHPYSPGGIITASAPARLRNWRTTGTGTQATFPRERAGG